LADDRELWQQIRAGDAAAFDAFYRDNAPRLQAFLRQMVGSAQAAEDIMQESFIQIWSRPNGFQPGRASLRTYLFGIGRKRAAEWWRRKKPEDSASDETIGHGNENAAIISDAFRRLPEDQRTMLWLREVEGQSYAELAEILDIPIGTVRSRLFAAREALRTIWRGPQSAVKERA
jgi:RNA polymerase sigma-70 factor, ECF subfamily